MKAIKDKYDPNLSIRENAEKCNCSVAAIRKYIRINGIDRRFDETLKRWKTINEYHQKHQEQSPYMIAKNLGISRNTVTKYLGSEMPSNDDTFKVSKFDISRQSNNILSVSENQQSILNGILTLYIKANRFDCDLTYSRGAFYRKGIVPQPLFKFDKYPQTTDTLPLDTIDDRIKDGTLNSIVFDLPYMVKQSWVTVKPKVIDFYTAFDTLDDLVSANKAMLELSERKLKSGGYLIVKTQDTSFQGKQYWISQIILNHAESIGLTHDDTFILVSKKLMFTRKKEKQHRARKNHCYFFVFKKRKK